MTNAVTQFHPRTRPLHEREQFCGQPPTTAWLWPVEYNSYGPAHTRLIMRPTGAVEYVLHDHLGSARITLDNAARVIESRSYTAFGDELTSSGTGARTSYIGRETDNESDLGFYGVRMYDPTYGRFLSTDPLWGKYLPLQSYQYAGNSPVGALDRGGDSIVVLFDRNGADELGFPFGHVAVLIGGDDTGWKLYSKNGGAYAIFGPSVEPQAGEPEATFATIAEFRKSAEDTRSDRQGRYDQALMIPTTKQQDARARSAAAAEVKSNYSIVGASCLNVVSEALKAAGKLPVIGVNRAGEAVRGLSFLPYLAFRMIASMAEAGNADKRVISTKRNDPKQSKE